MVFTGIIALTSKVEFDAETQHLSVPVLAEHGTFWEGIMPGDSVAVNGVCLTLLGDLTEGVAKFFLQRETLECTTFNGANGVFRANLERAMKAGSSYGGHLVLGHVHGKGKVVDIAVNKDGSWEMRVETPPVPPELGALFFRKGSITLDGVSLTIADLEKVPGTAQTVCRVSLIPYTLDHTTLHARAVGDEINVEFAPPSVQEGGGDEHPNPEEAWSFGLATSTRSDEDWMARAVELGERGRCSAPPNPWVACIIVAEDGRTVLGQGYHRQAGSHHAEVEALSDALRRLRPEIGDAEVAQILNDMRSEGSPAHGALWDLSRATMYVTLEPCHHTGRTPPCDRLVRGSGVGRVVVALLDPDERVAGQGVKYLQTHGVNVDVGVGKVTATRSLAAYLHHRRFGTPLCILKVAKSIDSRVGCADGTSRWITGPAARRHSHLLRAQSQAVMVGVATAITDRPQLTVRDVPDSMHPLTHQPLRVVLDTQGRLLEGPLLDDARTIPTLIFTSEYCNAGTRTVWERAGVEVAVVRIDQDGHVSLREALRVLGKRNILQVLVDGGPHLQGALLSQLPESIGRLYCYTGGVMLGASALPWSVRVMANTISEAKHFRWTPVEVSMLGQDVLAVYEPAPGTVRRATTEAGETEELGLSDMNRVIDAVASGRMVLVMDDASRENEGDLVMAARACGESHMQLMIRYTSGILCAPMLREHADRLDLPLMVRENKDKHHTAFTVTCDSKMVSTGVSASDRALTFRILGSARTSPEELNRPGHVFPLIAKDGLLKERSGHTEASVTLCKLAGIDPPVAAIGELTNDDGTMSRRRDVLHFARTHGIPVTTVAAIKHHLGLAPPETLAVGEQSRLQPASLLVECTIPVNRGGQDLGEWRMSCYNASAAPVVGAPAQDHVRVALVLGNVPKDGALVRLHSACFTGDVLGSGRCDCSTQLTLSMQSIYRAGSGCIIYETQQEGRGIGLVEKVKAYSLLEADVDLDTFGANRRLGHHEDLRDYTGCAEVLLALGIRKLTLLTSNPEKVKALRTHGFAVDMSSSPVTAPTTASNRRYIEAKVARGHSIGTVATVTDGTPSKGSEGTADSAASRGGGEPEGSGGPTKHKLPHKVPTSMATTMSVSRLRRTRVAILRTCWNEEWVDQLYDSCVDTLLEMGLPAGNIVSHRVPGSYELPLGSKMCIENGCDGVICIGVLMKGETYHFEYISGSVSSALMELQMRSGRPVIYGVLNVLTKEQAEARASPDSELGASWARSCLSMIALGDKLPA